MILPPSAGVIGWPVAHSKSPLIHRFWLEKLGLDGDYGRFPVHPDRLGEAIRALSALGLRGVNVTVPHKEAVLPYLDSVTRNAKAIGAVNTIRIDEQGRLHGRNTDVHGIWRSLDDVEARSGRIVLIGAGGAARAAAYALSSYKPEYVTILNRSRERAERLLSEFRLRGEVGPLDAVPAADLVINASPLGMEGQPPLPLSLARLESHTVVFDMVYAPLETPLLKEARKRRLRTIDGLTMLIHQADEAFGVFFHASAPRQHDAQLRKLLTA